MYLRMIEMNEDIVDIATEIARADGQIKAWEKRKDELKKQALGMGLRGCDVLTRSGDMIVSFSEGVQRAFDREKAIAVLGEKDYNKRLKDKQLKTTLTLSDYEGKYQDLISTDKIVAIKIEIKSR
jgi:hypothetical protein